MGKRWIFPTSMVALCVCISAAFGIYAFTHQGKNTTTGGNQTTSNANTLVSNFSYKGLPMLGKPNAPVKIVEFADFKCPVCMGWHNGNQQENLPAVFPSLDKQYIETGKVDFYFAPFPVISNTKNDMEAGEAIAAQSNSAFWKYYNAIYDHQQNEKTNWTTISFMTNFVKKYTPSVNVSKVVNAMKNQTYQNKIQQYQTIGQASGVQGTPTLYINGKKVTNAFDYPTIQTMINQDIKK